MKNSKFIAYLLLFIIAAFIFVKEQNAALPQEPLSKHQRSRQSLFPFKEFAVLGGFARGDLSGKDDYEIIPLIFRFGFDLGPFLEKNRIKLDSEDLFEFEFEPFVNTVIAPETNVEAGIGFLLKYGYFLNKRLLPYVEAGAGIIYMTQHTLEQATQFNFIPQLGIGMSYFIEDNLAVDVGYRRRHLSNCSIKEPNAGIEVDMLLAGVSLFY